MTSPLESPHVLAYPDLSAFQAGLSLKGAPFVIARASEGNWLRDAAHANFMAEAKRLGITANSYHFIESGSSAADQARFCHSIVGATPLMLDFEPIMGSSGTLTVDDPGDQGHYCGQAWRDLQAHAPQLASALDGNGERDWAAIAATASFISKPGIDKALEFIDHYRAFGGVCHLLYFPHWFWQILGSQSLERFINRRMVLVSSNYSALSGGAGWVPYGGMTPKVWQFADDHLFNGHRVDWNVTRHSVAELRALAATGSIHAAGNPVGDLHTEARYTQVDVHWPPAQHAVEYTVKAWQDAKVVKEVKTSRTSATLHNLREGQAYRITVWAAPGTGDPAEAHVTTKKA